MADISKFIARVHAYCEKRDVAHSTVSRKLLGNGKRLGELESGKSLRVDTLHRAEATLAALEKSPARKPTRKSQAVTQQ